MATTIAASLTLDSQQAQQSVKSFRTQLREAQQDLIRVSEEFGETSTQALAAARNVAGLRDRIQDAREVSELFDPAKRFQAFTNVVNVAAGGISALTGAMALFGEESEDVQKTLVKVQGALALSQGLSALANAGEDLSRFKAVAIDTFKSLKTAIGSTGIGLIVIAVGLLVTYFDDIKQALGGIGKEMQANLETAKLQYTAEKEKLEILSSEDNILKSQGKTEEDILRIKNKQIETTINAAQKELEAQQQIYDIQIKTAQSRKEALSGTILGELAQIFDPDGIKRDGDKANAALKLEIQKLQDQLAGNNLALKKSNVDFNNEILKLNQAAALDGIKDANKRSMQALKDQFDNDVAATNQQQLSAKDRATKLAAITNKYNADVLAAQRGHNKELLEKQRQFSRDSQQLQNQIDNLGITDADTLAARIRKQKYDDDVKTAEQTIKNKKQLNERLALLTTLYGETEKSIRTQKLKELNTNIASLEAERNEAKKKTEAEGLAIFLATGKQNVQAALDLNNELAQGQLDAAGQQYETGLAKLNEQLAARLTAVKGNQELEAQVYADYERQKTELAQQENMQRLSIVSSTLGQAADLFGKATAAGKVLAVAQATIDTYASAVSSYKSLSGIPIVGPALGFAAAAVAVAAGLANVKKILSVKTPGGGGGSVPSISASAPITPTTPQATNTILPQDQINQLGQAGNTVRAYVVSADISSAQEREVRVSRAAKLGG